MGEPSIFGSKMGTVPNFVLAKSRRGKGSGSIELECNVKPMWGGGVEAHGFGDGPKVEEFLIFQERGTW